MAGGWKRRLRAAPSSHFRNAAMRRDPAPRPTAGFATSLSSPIPGNETMSMATASDLEIAPARLWLTPLLSAAACVALADWLFYGWQIGVSLPLFFGALGVVAVAGNRAGAPRHIQIIMAAVFTAGLVALIEEVNELSVTAGALATPLF